MLDDRLQTFCVILIPFHCVGLSCTGLPESEYRGIVSLRHMPYELVDLSRGIEFLLAGGLVEDTIEPVGAA